jgi:mannose-1-phosphate guanylyltransferase
VSTPDTALVLTAGLGTRLRPLTYVRAKPAVPVVGETVVRRILRWLGGSGIREAVLNLHYRPEGIAAEAGDGSDLGVRVRYSWEQPILGSAGGPRHALPVLACDTFFIVNGDTMTDVDLGALAEAHTRSGATATLALTRTRDPRRYGGVVLDGEGAVVKFVRRGAPEAAEHFVGVQIVDRSAFSDLPDAVPAEAFGGVYQQLAARRPGSVRGFTCDADFWDIGTPGDYLAATQAIARNEGVVRLPVGHRSRIDPSSRLHDTIVWDDVVVEKDCELIRCIIADGARIPAGSRFADMAIVAADGRTAGAGEMVAGGLLTARIAGTDVG